MKLFEKKTQKYVSLSASELLIISVCRPNNGSQSSVQTSFSTEKLNIPNEY